MAPVSLPMNALNVCHWIDRYSGRALISGNSTKCLGIAAAEKGGGKSFPFRLKRGTRVQYNHVCFRKENSNRDFQLLHFFWKWSPVAGKWSGLSDPLIYSGRGMLPNFWSLWAELSWDRPCEKLKKPVEASSRLSLFWIMGKHWFLMFFYYTHNPLFVLAKSLQSVLRIALGAGSAKAEPFRMLVGRLSTHDEEQMATSFRGQLPVLRQIIGISLHDVVRIDKLSPVSSLFFPSFERERKKKFRFFMQRWRDW